MASKTSPVLAIRIELGNAAFEEGGVQEIGRLFGSIESRLPLDLSDTNGALNLHDANGNHCGTAEIRMDRTESPAVTTLRNVLKHNKALKAEYRLPSSLIREIEQAITQA